MDVILLERVEKLGQIGDVVKVKPGYARNFLLPRGKALRASEQNRQRFEADRARIEAENATRRETAEKDSASLRDKSLVLIRQASNTGQLYGSVSARDLADALVADGATVTRDQVVLDRPMKTLGVYDVRVVLHPEVSVTVRVNIARSAEEAELQSKGVDIRASRFEREASGFTEDFDEEPAATRDAGEAGGGRGAGAETEGRPS